MQKKGFHALLFEQAFEPIIIRRLDGLITEWNRGAVELYGYGRDEAVGVVSHDLLKTVFPVSLLEFNQRLARDGHWIGELIQTARDGRLITVESRHQLFVQPDGTQLVLETNREVSFHEAQFRAAFEGTSVGMCQAAPETGQLLRVNRRFCEMTGFSESELLGRPFSEITHPDDSVVNLEGFKRMVRGEIPEYRMEMRYVRKDGSVFVGDATINLVRDTVGRSLCAVAVIQDITARTQAEAALRESEARLRLALDSVEMGMWDWNLATDRLTWDARQFALFGIAPEDFSGNSADAISRTHPEDRERVTQAIRQAIEQRIPFNEEFRIVHDDGQVHWVAGIGQPITDKSGQVARMIGVNFDVTARKQEELAREHRHEEEMARLYRIGTVNELAGGLAHELSQPLTAIQNYAGGILKWVEAGGNPKETRHALEEINTQSGRVVEIIHHLRRFMSTGEPQHSPTDLNEVVRRACELLKIPLARKNIRLELALAPDLPKLFIDALQIEQVVIILMRNCIDAFAREFLATPAIEVRTAALAGAGVEVTVSDNGPGVAPEVLQRMFEPFYTTKEKGMGLGLMLARSIVRAHSGSIGALPSASGSGLAVRFTLPADRSEYG